MLFVNSLWIFWQLVWSLIILRIRIGRIQSETGCILLMPILKLIMSIYFEIDIPPNLSQPGRRQQWNLFSNQSEVVKLASAFEKSTYANFLARNGHMLIYQNEVTYVDYKCSYWTKSTYDDFSSSWQTLHYGSDRKLYTCPVCHMGNPDYFNASS